MNHRRFCSSLTAIALSAGLSGAGAESEMWPQEIIDLMDDQRLVVFLPNMDITASPRWLPATGTPPPLNIADAMAHLKEWMSGNPRYRECEIHEIELKPIHDHEEEHRWYYLFQLRQDDGGKHKTLYAAVLLNGKVVPALAEPESIK